MATNVLSAGSGYAESVDQTLVGGETTTVCLKAAAQDAKVAVQIKDDEGEYNHVAFLVKDDPALLLAGPVVFRVVRLGTAACGVFRA